MREQAGDRSLVVFDRGDEVTVQAGDQGVRFLLVSGKTDRGARRPGTGRSLMNTREQLQQAVKELQDGTFIKQR